MSLFSMHWTSGRRFRRNHRGIVMTSPFDTPKLRIPVKLVQGQWEYFYGGGVPVAEGTIGDLVVERAAVTDRDFLGALRRPSVHRVLNEGTNLMVALTIRTPLDQQLQAHLRELRPEERAAEYYESVRPAQTRFVQITIGAPTAAAFKRLGREDAGGVWLHFEGTQPKGVSVSSVQLPNVVQPGNVDSLNHAFSCLSTVFEPWRKSHTGNVYTRVLYQERNSKWYPLETLRRAAEAAEEQTLIRERWAEIAQALLPGMESGTR
jgi:hypothetical protein